MRNSPPPQNHTHIPQHAEDHPLTMQCLGLQPVSITCGSQGTSPLVAC